MVVLANMIRRGTLALPFSVLATVCFREMDGDKLFANNQPFIDSRTLTWPGGGSIPMLWDVFHIHFMDDICRGITPSFAPSTFGYDAVAWWQIFSFLIDLGPVYAVWILESCRLGNAWSPAALSGVLIFVAQLIGIGNVGPVFYGLCYIFCPSVTELRRSGLSAGNGGKRSSAGVIPRDTVVPILPLILLFHTSHVFVMFLAPELSTRHFWTWLWQFSPAWIGIGCLAVPRIMRLLGSHAAAPGRHDLLSSSTFLLLVLSLISAAVWITLLVSSPYPLTTVFIPDMETQVGFIEHTRRAIQIDELSSFAAGYLWLVYLFVDLRAAGLVDTVWIIGRIALLPALAICIGPGAAFAAGWLLREGKLSMGLKKRSVQQ